MRESTYQAGLIKRLRERFPTCIILKNDSAYIQGIPDLTILYNQTWAALEVKAEMMSRVQNNQQYYVDTMNEMSFAAFICPENEEEVLGALQQAFESARPARVS